MSLTIHDEAAFNYTSDQIIACIDNRCATDKVISYRNPDDVREVYTKIFKPSLADNRSSRLNNRGNIFSISVKNLFGEEVPIVDFYTAMGYLISETDPVPEHLPFNKEISIERRFLDSRPQHDTMLINFAKWCATMYDERFGEQDLSIRFPETAPNTVCLGWVIADGTWSPQVSASSKFTPGRSTFAAVFTNMHEPNKAEMKKEVKNALERFFGPLTNAPRLSMNTFIDYGHCAENIMYTFFSRFSHTDVEPPMLLYGTTVALERKFYDAHSFNKDLIRQCGKAACPNCVSLVAQASAPAHHPVGFQYLDLVSGITHVTCLACENVAVHTCWCETCRFNSNALYCSEEHRLHDWRMKHYRECSYRHSQYPGMRMCANCQVILKQPQPLDSQARKCSDCSHIAQAPWYCSLVCQEEHWSIHWNHCRSGPLSRCPACFSPLQGSSTACNSPSCTAIYCDNSCRMKHWIELQHSETCKPPAGPKRCYLCADINRDTKADFVHSCNCGRSTLTYCSWYCQADHWIKLGHSGECPESRTTCWMCFRSILPGTAIPFECPVDNCEYCYCGEECLKDDFKAGHYMRCNGTQQRCCSCGNELSGAFIPCSSVDHKKRVSRCDRVKWCSEVCKERNLSKHIRLASYS